MPGGIHPPHAVVATWPRPNFVDPIKHSHATAGVMTVLGIAVVGTVLARLWARAVVQRRAGLDDWLMLVSLVPTIGLIIGTVIGMLIRGGLVAKTNKCKQTRDSSIAISGTTNRQNG